MKDSPRRFGRYEVERLLGQGQMGTVYLASDPLIERSVAVKVLRNRPELDCEEAAEWRARFEREVRVTGKLSHPNIVSVLDVGLDDDTAFIVMEYVDGANIEELLGKQRTLSVDRVLAICSDVADALDAAHAHGIVHRDIKPGNILVTGEGHAKVADFGIAHVTGSRMTQTGMTYGTPAFMSPEQAAATEIGPSSDQFSLAAVAYLMLAGEVPFSGSSTSAVLYRLINEEPVPPESLNPNVSEALSAALVRALSKNPANRYPDCGAMIEALRTAQHDVSSVLAATAKMTPNASPVSTLADEVGGNPTIPSSHGVVGSRMAVLAGPALVALMLLAWAILGTKGGPEEPANGSSRPAVLGSLDAAAPPQASRMLPRKLAERAENATKVLDEVLGVGEGIPQSLLVKARCVAVVPGVIKVGFGFGGRHGKGLLSCRTSEGWSSPSFVAMTGGSFGLQIGAQSTDHVLVFTTRRAAERLAENQITLGGDASVSAGPVGRTAEAGTNIKFESEIYSYSRSKGLFAGMSLEGTTLRTDEDANRDAYGRGVNPADLLSARRPVAPELAELMRKLESAGR